MSDEVELLDVGRSAASELTAQAVRWAASQLGALGVLRGEESGLLVLYVDEGRALDAAKLSTWSGDCGGERVEGLFGRVVVRFTAGLGRGWALSCGNRVVWNEGA